nr:peptide chain release factor N(5)-glutamine methyltransferase [Desulforadius tongensis]
MAGARALLQQKDIEQPRLDAEVLLAHVLGCSRAALYAGAHRRLEPGQLQHYNRLVQKRAQGHPVAYLVGHKEFMGLDFTVTPAVLIPRPDTELLVETAVHLLSKRAGGRPLMVDVGTGSGAIAVSTAHLVPTLRVLAVDISAPALEVAQKNARTHAVDDRVVFLKGSLLEPVMERLNGEPVDIIAANLPYVPSGDIPGLSREVRREPLLALDGGPDGLDLYRQLIPQAQKLIKPGGHLLLEIGPGQGETALNLLNNWQAKLYRDLGGRERLIAAEKR